MIFIKEHRLTKIDTRLKPVIQLTSYFGQVLPTTPQTCTKNDFSNQLLVWDPRLHLLVFLKGYRFTKLNSRLIFTRNDAGLKPLLQMTSNFGQAFSQHPRQISKMISQASYWFELPVFICYLIKEHRLTKIDAGLKPVIQLTSYFGQVLPTTPQTCTQNDFSNQLLVWAPRLHLLYFLKGYMFAKLNSRLIFTGNDAGLKPLLQMTSNFGQVFPSTPQISTQNGHSNRLPVWAPSHHLLFSLKGTQPQKLMPDSNQNSDWPHILARSYPQHLRHVPKMNCHTGYWFEPPVIIGYFH